MSKNTEISPLRTQFAFMVVSRGLGSGLQAILVIVFARIAGTEGMGIVAIATGALSMILSIAEFGMSPLLSKSRAVGDDELVNAIVRVNFISSISFGLCGFILAFWYLDHNGLPLAVACLALSVALEKNTDVSLNIPIADGKKWVPAASVVLRRACSLIFFCALFWLDKDPLHAYVWALLASAVIGQCHIQLYRKNNVMASSRTGFQELLSKALPFSVSNISGQTRNLDTVLIGVVASVGTAGLYSAALKLTNPLSLLASSLTSVIMPFAARNDHSYSVMLGRRLAYLAAASFVVIIPLAFYSEPIVTALLGEAYREAAGAFLGGIVALPFLSLASPLGSILQSRGQQKYVAVNGVVFAVVTLALVALGAMFWGAGGASGGLAVSFALKFVSLWIRLISMPEGPSLPEQTANKL